MYVKSTTFVMMVVDFAKNCSILILTIKRKECFSWYYTELTVLINMKASLKIRGLD